jgi:hypothetical protein
MSFADYYYILQVDSAHQSNLFKLPNDSKEAVLSVLQEYNKSPLSSIKAKTGLELAPEPSNAVPERWGVCFEYIWIHEDSIIYLVEQLYNPMISLSGKFALFPGIKLSSFLVETEKCQAIHDYLVQSEISKYYKILPASMYNVFIHFVADKLSLGALFEQFVNRIGSGMVDWNENRWNECGDTTLTAHPLEIFFRQTLGLHVAFDDNSNSFVAGTLENCRRNFQLPDDKSKPVLILGYKYNVEMPPPSLVEEVAKDLRAIMSSTVQLDLPRFYTYESMDDFERIRK